MRGGEGESRADGLAPTYTIGLVRRARFNKAPVTSACGCAGAEKLISGSDTLLRAGVRHLLWQRRNEACIEFGLKTPHMAVVSGRH